MKTEFYTHLLNQGFAINTCRKKRNDVNQYLTWLGGREANNYNHLMAYIKEKKAQGLQVQTIRMNLKSIANYFDYLTEETNQASIIKLQGGTIKLPNHLLSEEELNEIYQVKTTTGLVQKRNKLILSLILFQGLGRRDLSNIEVNDLDLEEGEIYIPKTRTTNSRTLDLKVKQALGLQDYLLKTRPTLLKEYQKEDRGLLFFSLGTGQGVNGMDNVMMAMLKQMRLTYPKLKTFSQVRQSVITNWIKQYGLRQTQYMAGHKYVSSTERYEESKTEKLKQELDRYHPL